MNIFVLDNNINKCAEYHCDKHVVKMILEYAQMLSTTLRLSGEELGYKATHINHPCNIWVRESLSNWLYLKNLLVLLNDQYRSRYDKDVNHKSFDMVMALPEPKIEDKGLTPFVTCMPDEYKVECPIQSYRNFYVGDKKDFATWKNTTPRWFNPVVSVS